MPTTNDPKSHINLGVIVRRMARTYHARNVKHAFRLVRKAHWNLALARQTGHPLAAALEESQVPIPTPSNIDGIIFALLDILRLYSHQSIVGILTKMDDCAAELKAEDQQGHFRPKEVR